MIAAMLAGVLLASAPAAEVRPGEGVVQRPSPYPVAETVDRIEALAKSKGLTVFARIDHAGEAARAGLKLRPTQLLLFGSPKGGTPLMVVSPTAAIDLPMKALAWEDEQGKVWVGTNDPAWLKARHRLPDELVRPLAGIAALVEQALR